MTEPLQGEIIPAGAPMGRPSVYSEAIVSEICTRLSLGEGLIRICNDEHMPHRVTVFRWLDDPRHEDFRNRYARAREVQADSLFDEMEQIADDGSNDWMEKKDRNGDTIGWMVNGEAVARSKLRLEDRRWRAGKLRPKKYGEATLLKVGDHEGNAIPSQLTDVAAGVAALLAVAKDRKEKGE